MKILTTLFFTLIVLFYASIPVNAQHYQAPPGKEIFIPQDLKENDFTDANSKWSYARMAYTENIVVFWEKGFGNDLSSPPDLEGHNMSVDLNNLLEKLETFYRYYRDELKFVLSGSKSERYRMMVMLNYSLEGTAYGGDYDGTIGALWIAPNRVKDKTLNCIAHELGHSFQSQIMADGTGECWGGGGIFEMTSQWMLWNVNPNWVTDENYHWKGFCEHFNKRFLDGENIYHSPYVLEYWSYKHGKTIIADLFRAGKRGEDPTSTYMRMFNLTPSMMADEMLDCYSRLVTFDFPRVKSTHKKYACELITPSESTKSGKKTIIRPKADKLPGIYGFNVIELPLSSKTKTIEFTAEPLESTDGYKYGIVLVDKDMNATYLPTSDKNTNKLKYKTSDDTSRAFFVVTGFPKDKYEPFRFSRRNREQKADKTYPYSLIIK